MTEPQANSTILLQLEEQVAAALELPDKARRVAFEKLREAHPEHGPLLDRCERAAASLEPELRSVDALSKAVRAAALEEAPKQIENYKILDVLGEGGMGVVYLADQHQPVRRRVALKVIKQVAVDSDVLARFELERQSLAMMDHPNIAKVLDAGETADGRPFFAMEHVPGMSINEYCDRQKLDIAARIELFQKVCHGVQHAHQKGVIHRDLKPSNILVASRDGYVEPKIIDFGVAKALQQRLTERTLYTEQGRILGTPEYMSPEQAEMSVLDVDTRSDIYSLGVLLYNLLAGMLPIDGRELRQAGYFEMQRRIREEEPQRPSTRVSTIHGDAGEQLAGHRRTDAHKLRDALRGDLDWIVMRCLEKDPARRYQSASELAADLQRHLADEPVLAGPPSALYRLRKLARRHRVPFAAGAAALLALIAGLSVAIWQYRVASDNAEMAQNNAEEAKDNLATARANERRALAAEVRAEQELTKSQALNLAAVSMQALEQDPIDGLLLALAAVERDSNPVTLGRVQTALAENHLVRRLPAAPASSRGVDFGARTRTILRVCGDGMIQLLTEDGNELLSLETNELIVSARFTSDEQRIRVVAATQGRMLARLYDRTGQRVTAIGDAEPLTGVDWFPDGSRILVRYADQGRLAVLDVAGQLVTELLPTTKGQPPAQMFPTIVSVSPQGHAVFLNPRQMKIWRELEKPPITLQLERGQPSFPQPLVRDANGRYLGITYLRGPNNIAFDPRGELVATRLRGDTPWLWSMTGESVGPLQGHSYSVRSIAFAPDGDAILTASGDGTARVWSREGRQTDVIRHGAEVSGARFLAGSKRILTWNNFSTALWSRTGARLAEMRGTNSAGVRAVISDDGNRLLMKGSGRCSVWSLAGATNSSARGPYDRPYQIAPMPGGGVLATSETGHVVAWRDDGSIERIFDPGSGTPTYGVGASLDGARIAAGGVDGTLYGWDRATGKELWQHKVGRSPVTHVYWLAGGKRLLAAMSPDRSAYLVDPETKQNKRLMGRDDGPCVWAFASPDGKLIALQSLDRGRIRFCDSDGELITDFRPDDGEGGAAWRIAFDRGGRWLGLARHHGEVSIWNLQEVLGGKRDIEPLHRIQHGARAYSIDFSPDGSRFVAALDGSAYVADLDGTEHFRVWPREGRFTGYLPPVAMFSADGRWLLGAGADGVRRWPASSELLLRLARDFVSRHGEGHDLGEYAEALEPTPTGR